MSIKKAFKSIAEWYDNLSFLKKLIYVYLVCGVLPMLLILVFFYQNTVRLMNRQAYTSLSQNTIITENSLNTAFEPYKTMIENLKNDKTLNTQLNVDYSELSYSDLAYYMKNHIDSLITLYPDITDIRFYSSNETLPDDEHYFYSIDELDTKFQTELEKTDENIVVGRKTGSDRSYLVLVSEMNYYSSEETQNYIQIELSDDFLSGILFTDDEMQRSYLLNQYGIVLEASNRSEIGKSFATEMPDWKVLETTGVETVTNAKGREKLCTKSTMEMGMTLILEYDREYIMNSSRNTPLLLLILLGGISLFLFGIIISQGRRLNDRLWYIIHSLNAVGSGDFSGQIESKGTAEFGQIEAAVNQMSSKINSLVHDNYEKQLMLKSSELNLLQEQINPHFLYNALGVISSLSIREGAKATTQSIRYLADFYRISLNKGRNVIRVSEEFELLKSYMQIQLLRFDEYVEIFYDMDPEIGGCYTIKLLLQPLVENAIHHAREEETFLTIHVRACKKEDRICFDVEDNGMGIAPDKLEQLQEELLRQEEGFGLKNVDKRIKLAYGQDYGVTIYSQPGHGTVIHLEIPELREYRKEIV